MNKLTENVKLLKGLRILNFNIEGLDSGLQDPSLIDVINRHDICILTETWKKDD